MAINTWTASADVHTLADDGMLVLLDGAFHCVCVRCCAVVTECRLNGCAGKKHVVYGQEFPTGLRLTVCCSPPLCCCGVVCSFARSQVDGKTCLFREEYDPTSLRSNMQGTRSHALTLTLTHSVIHSSFILSLFVHSFTHC